MFCHLDWIKSCCVYIDFSVNFKQCPVNILCVIVNDQKLTPVYCAVLTNRRMTTNQQTECVHFDSCYLRYSTVVLACNELCQLNFTLNIFFESNMQIRGFSVCISFFWQTHSHLKVKINSCLVNFLFCTRPKRNVSRI